ncbi:MAG TPA: transposase [Actinocrinis sp.]|nr:transposase [Actinocrinis sp.]
MCPRRPRVRPLGGLRDWPASSSKQIHASRAAAVVLRRPRSPRLEFAEAWEAGYPAIVKLGTNAWPKVVPCLGFDREIRSLLSTTDAVESLNARLRRAVKASGHFPTELAALKRLYLAILSLDPSGKAPQRWSNRWKPALNAFETAFDIRRAPEPEPELGRRSENRRHTLKSDP